MFLYTFICYIALRCGFILLMLLEYRDLVVCGIAMFFIVALHTEAQVHSFLMEIKTFTHQDIL